MKYSGVTSYEGTEYLNIDCTTGGNGKFITNGKAIDITWEKDSEYGVTRYFDEDGNEITLNQGKTWVCIIDNSKIDSIEILGTKEETEN